MRFTAFIVLLLSCATLSPISAQPISQSISATINEIQGPGDRSPFEGRSVTTQGVVTARRANGFYIQSIAADDDDNPLTSEGLLIFTQTAPAAAIVPRSLVRVTGTVTEFRPASDPGSPTLTELTQPTVEVIGSSTSLPATVRLPADGEWEPYEGMRVATGQLEVVSPTQGTFNERTGESTTNGLCFAVPFGMPRPYKRATPRLPYVLRLDTRTLAAGNETPASFNTGDRILPEGILDFGVRTYTLLTQGAIPQLRIASLAPVLPVPASTEFLMGSLNLQRLYDATDDRNGGVVISEAGYNRRLVRTAAYIRERMRMPQILAVQEVESQSVLDALAARLGPQYWAITATSNDPGAIRNGLLVNTEAVTIESVAEFGKDATFLAPGNARPSITMDRPMLVARLRVGSLPLTVAVVHQRSLSDAETPFVQAKRRAQAELVAEDLAALQAAEPGRALAVVGDWNAFEFDDGLVDVLGIVTRGAGLRNLTNTLPVEERYSYLFDGQTQTLDHLLANAPLLRLFQRLGYARGNADSAEIQRNNNESPNRVSDHDGLVGYFLRQPTALPQSAVVNAISFLQTPLAPGAFLTAFGEGFGAGTARWEMRLGGQSLPLLFSGNNQLVAQLPMLFARPPMGLGPAIVTVHRGTETVGTVALPVSSVAPAISGVVLQGDRVVIRGSGFGGGIGDGSGGSGNQASRITAFLCNQAAEVRSQAATQITLLLPRGCTPGSQPLDLAADGIYAQPHLQVNLP